MTNFPHEMSWLIGPAAFVFLGSSILYLRTAGELSTYINTNCPDLWGQMAFKDFVGKYGARQRAGGLTGLILYGSGSRYHPNDAGFRQLLNKARWCAFICLASFVVALILFGSATGAPHAP